jgi:hypothetical protein
MPLRRMLVLALSVSLILGLTLMFFVYVSGSLRDLRYHITEQYSMLAEVAGRNAHDDLAAGNRAGATRVLSTLAADHAVLGAALYDADGKLFVQYGNLGASPNCIWQERCFPRCWNPRSA